MRVKKIKARKTDVEIYGMGFFLSDTQFNKSHINSKPKRDTNQLSENLNQPQGFNPIGYCLNFIINIP